MIFHLSVPARDPASFAGILARLVAGRDFPFHPVDGARIVLFGDKHGSAVEVYPETVELTKGANAVQFGRIKPARSHFSTHAAIATPLSEADILAICNEVGWTARSCDRGPFELIEVWAEDRFLFEFLPPDAQQDYRRAMTFESWQGW
jgi:hypothetical protein